MDKMVSKTPTIRLGLCYWLNGNTNDAAEIFKQARSRGKEASEADKYAARSLAETELPHVNLTKARYAIDGGYYEQARQILESLAARGYSNKTRSGGIFLSQS